MQKISEISVNSIKYRMELEEALRRHLHDNIRMSLEVEIQDDNRKDFPKVFSEKEKDEWRNISIEEILNSSHKYFKIVNNSGAGKTIFLYWLAIEILKSPKTYYPILRECDCVCSENDVIKAIKTEYSETVISLFKKDNWNSVIILLDGFDQCSHKEELCKKLLLHPKDNLFDAKIIVATRDHSANYLNSDFKTLRLLPPTEKEVLNYLGILYENPNVINLLQKNRDFFRVPLFIEILKFLASSKESLSNIRNKGNLFDCFIKYIGIEYRNKFPFLEKEIAFFLDSSLEEIAFNSMSKGHYLKLSKREDLENYADRYELLCNSGLLINVFEEDTLDDIIFRHQSFQAYYCARYILNNPDKDYFFALKDFYLHDAWGEVIEFCIILAYSWENKIKKEQFKKGGKYHWEKLVRFIYPSKKEDDIVITRLIFTCNCLSQLNDITPFYKELEETVKNIIVNKSYLHDGKLLKIDFMGLVDFLVNNPGLKDSKIIDYIGESGNPSYLELLWLKLKFQNIDPDVRKSIVRAFSEIGEAIHVGKLINSLHTESDPLVRNSIVTIIGNIGKAEHANILVKLLSNETDVYVRAEIYKTIGEIGESKYVEMLIEAFQKEIEVDVRRNIAYAIGELGESKHVDILVNGFHNESDPNVKSSIVSTVGKLGESKHADMLVNAFREESKPFVRWLILDAISKLGKYRHADILFDILPKEPERVVIKMIAYTIGKIGTHMHADMLVNAFLKETKVDIRRKFSYAIGEIAKSRHADMLVGAFLKESRADIKRNIAYAIGEIGSSEHADVLVDAFQKESDAGIRRSIIIAIGKIGSSEHADVLIDAFQKEKDADIRINIVNAIDGIGRSEHADVLIDAFQKEINAYVRERVAFAIETIGKSKHVYMLIEILQKEVDPFVRSIIVYAIRKIGKAEHADILIEVFQKETDFSVRENIVETIRKFLKLKIQAELPRFDNDSESNTVALTAKNRSHMARVDNDKTIRSASHNRIITPFDKLILKYKNNKPKSKKDGGYKLDCFVLLSEIEKRFAIIYNNTPYDIPIEEKEFLLLLKLAERSVNININNGWLDKKEILNIRNLSESSRQTSYNIISNLKLNYLCIRNNAFRILIENKSRKGKYRISTDPENIIIN